MRRVASQVASYIISTQEEDGVGIKDLDIHTIIKPQIPNALIELTRSTEVCPKSCELPVTDCRKNL